MKEDNFRFLNYEQLKRVVDNAYDEIFVYDNEYNVVYVNKACERHYEQAAEEIIGSNFHKLLSEEMCYPPLLPDIYREKKQMTIEQTSYLGEKLITTAVPLFDENNEIELVVMSVYDASCDFVNQRLEIEGRIKNNGIEKSDSVDFVDVSKSVIYTDSESMKETLAFADNIAGFESTLLIHGESGTGKTLLAKYIHEKSPRREAPFISLNCAAIAENLLESELFGYEEGAFTGAIKGGKVGLVELANGGTILLDEIGELSLGVQAKILHVIQDKSYIPVGGSKMKRADIRIIAATNKDLFTQVEKKQFREDLYWRLNVVEIELLPLRRRKADIKYLSDRFLQMYNQKHDQSKSLSVDCLNFFYEYHWPGNIRQLENLIERLVITSVRSTIKRSDLPNLMFRQVVENKEVYEFEGSFEYAVEQFEKNIVVKAYQTHNSTRKLADELKITQTKAARLIRKYCK